MNVVNKVTCVTRQLTQPEIEKWPLRRSVLIDDMAAVGPISPDRRAVVSSPLVVLVGLTGAGKTTLVRALTGAGLVAELPDRRLLTDAVILGHRAANLDRTGRFAATAAFRRRAPGGMGEILAALSVAAPPVKPLLFDGLRGADEIAFFADRAPEAVFIALQAADAIRAQRIASRGDRFDGAATDDAARARALVGEESKHYSFAAALKALEVGAPGRFHVLNADRCGPDEIGRDAAAIIRSAFG